MFFPLKIWLFLKHCLNFLCILPYCAGQATVYKIIQLNADLLIKTHFRCTGFKNKITRETTNVLVALSVT